MNLPPAQDNGDPWTAEALVREARFYRAQAKASISEAHAKLMDEWADQYQRAADEIRENES